MPYVIVTVYFTSLLLCFGSTAATWQAQARSVFVQLSLPSHRHREALAVLCMVETVAADIRIKITSNSLLIKALVNYSNIICNGLKS